MLAALRKSMEARRAELRRIAKDELRLLNLKLEQAVDAELFEEVRALRHNGVESEETPHMRIEQVSFLRHGVSSLSSFIEQ